MKPLRVITCSALAALTLASFAAAGSHNQEKKMGEAKMDKPAGQAQMTAEEQKMMEMYMKAATPGAEHQHMASRAGNWDATVTSWMKPGAPPTVSQGKSERKMALGGRVMEEHWSGNMMDMPFEGMGMGGYDNVSKKHWGIWMDNMGTGMMKSEGTCDMAKKSCTFMTEYNDAMSGGPIKGRIVTSWTGPDDETMEMYGPGPDGKEFKMMEIVSKRAKAAM